MLPIRNLSYLLPMCCSFWEKCKNSPKTGLACSTPLSTLKYVFIVVVKGCSSWQVLFLCKKPVKWNKYMTWIWILIEFELFIEMKLLSPFQFISVFSVFIVLRNTAILCKQKMISRSNARKSWKILLRTARIKLNRWRQRCRSVLNREEKMTMSRFTMRNCGKWK